MLAHVGALRHHTVEGGGYRRGAVGQQAGADAHDRINDVLLRAALGDWFARNGGGARLGSDPHALDKMRDKIPAYDGQGRLLLGGEWG